MASAPADALADRGEDVQELEHEQERLHERTDHELDLVLPQDDEVAEDQRSEGRPAGRELRPRRLDRDPRRALGYGDGGSIGSGHQSRSSLPVRLMNTVSRLGSETARSASSNPARSAAPTTRGTSRSAPLTWSSTVPSTTRVRVTSGRSRASCSASASPSPEAFSVTIVSASTDCLRAAGVSRARIRPWSMIATRSQSSSASSMWWVVNITV